MTVDPLALAKLHARCFETPRPWNVDEFSQWLAGNNTIFVGDEQGFALGRTAADEAELLTIAVAPDVRRAGMARKLLLRFEQKAVHRAATTCFLEVAANNFAAIALYQSQGYTESGLRKRYYRQQGGKHVDALVFAKPLIMP